VQQEGAAVVLGAVARLRHQKKIRLCIHDRFQGRKAAGGDAEIGGCVEQPGLGQ
jgi:hypothetical protein